MLLYIGAVEAGQIVASVCAGVKVESCSALNPVDVGACYGMTLQDIREMLGISLLEQMRKNPCEARLPGGESQQVCDRWRALWWSKYDLL